MRGWLLFQDVQVRRDVAAVRMTGRRAAVSCSHVNFNAGARRFHSLAAGLGGLDVHHFSLNAGASWKSLDLHHPFCKLSGCPSIFLPPGHRFSF